MSRFNLPICLFSLLLCHSIAKAQVFEKTAVLHGDSVVFPITLINAYPFISATVNGVSGKFMFDTGHAKSMMLNDHLVILPDKKPKGDGVVGSGQSFKVNANDTIQEIKFPNGITFKNLENINSANYDFLQKYVTPDFLGFIGHDFFQGYVFKIDYMHRKVTFYKNSAERSKSRDYLAHEKILAVLDFEIRKIVNSPIVKLKIDGINVIGAFDTGQNGSLQLDKSSNEALRSKGAVQNSGIDSSRDTLLNVKNITIDGKLETSLKGVESTTLAHNQITRKALGINEPNLMTFGYRFLSQYKTVWDYAAKKIYILEY